MCHLRAQNFQAVQKGAGHMQEQGYEAVPLVGQSFKEMKHKKAGQAEQRSFEAEVAKELYRLSNAPASEYEVTHLITNTALCQRPKVVDRGRSAAAVLHGVQHAKGGYKLMQNNG